MAEYVDSINTSTFLKISNFQYSNNYIILTKKVHTVVITMYNSHSAHTGHQTIYLISSSAGMLCSPKHLGKESESEYFLNSPETQE